jgi:hypothetical protein
MGAGEGLFLLKEKSLWKKKGNVTVSRFREKPVF